MPEKHHLFNLHKKVKEVVGNNWKSDSGLLLDGRGDNISGLEEKLQTWKPSISRLFNDNRIPKPPDEYHKHNEDDPPIRKEMIWATR